ncbi:MAG: Mrp/NBP35 family ATP-binding protein [Bacteroidia bacterium]|nr:Mrp/NBP35 family ATP-binding protein [Bacteroidia bacterium]
MVSREAVIYDALRTVIDPDLQQNIVDAGMVKGVAWNEENGQLSLTLQLTTPACPLKGYFEQQIGEAVRRAMGERWEVKIDFRAHTLGASAAHLPQVKNLLLIASGKGGVGKSTVAVNLAIALAQAGARVGLLDADIYGPSVPILLGLEHAKPAVREIDGRPYLIPISKYGLSVMSLGFLVPPHQATPWRGPMASNTLRQLLTETDWPELDYLIVDMPPGTGDIQLTLAQQFRPQGAIIVTTPQKVALADAEKALVMFQMPLVQVPVLGIIENMAYFWTADLPERKFYIFGQNGGRMLAEKYDIPFLGEIPLLEEVVQRSDAGIPAALSTETPMADVFSHLAGTLAREVARLAFANTNTLS